MIDEREKRLHTENGRRVAPLLLKPEEAAEALGIARTRVYQLMRAGEIRSVKIGKIRYVLRGVVGSNPTPSARACWLARRGRRQTGLITQGRPPRYRVRSRER